MSAVIQPLALLAIIVVGYLFKRFRVFGQRDYNVLKAAVFDLTLPCAIVRSFATNEHDPSMLLISVFGFFACLLPILVMFVASRRMPVGRRVFLMLNGSGLNVGNFCLPVVTAIMGPTVAISVIMFDIGNSIMVCAGMYVLTVLLLHVPEDRPLSPEEAAGARLLPRVRPTDRQARRLAMRAHIRTVLKSFVSSVPFDTYIVMVVLMLAGVTIPGFIGDFVEPVAQANGFCSMLMVGMMMDLPASRRDVIDVAQVIGCKLVFVALLATAAWFLLPFDPMTRKAVVLICMAPTAVFSVMFTDRVLGNAKLAGFTLACTGVLSLVLMTVANLLIPA
ncbi:AEC family transporter [Bifidobacterium pullorum subsp. saeculare]|uniref:AEC family transporter n=1 Tax=Bifidobacterium pullorum subsp. saeculare TaxID=78257 RepID=A0A938WYM2_9BIFI|nr:AEC family transporter [Bifidobacterium pullorum]MBM6700256.1 AEC family transporter [Bifidobacterium pullorum subsp. saeculare]